MSGDGEMGVLISPSPAISRSPFVPTLACLCTNWSYTPATVATPDLLMKTDLAVNYGAFDCVPKRGQAPVGRFRVGIRRDPDTDF